MKIGLSNKDQTKVSDAFSVLGEVCGNMWDNIFDDKSEEKIKKLEKKIWNLEEEIQTLSEERKKLEKSK
jgi:outer membrane protein assembly factor BamD (BamD/ComL family)